MPAGRRHAGRRHQRGGRLSQVRLAQAEVQLTGRVHPILGQLLPRKQQQQRHTRRQLRATHIHTILVRLQPHQKSLRKALGSVQERRHPVPENDAGEPPLRDHGAARHAGRGTRRTPPPGTQDHGPGKVRTNEATPEETTPTEADPAATPQHIGQGTGVFVRGSESSLAGIAPDPETTEGNAGARPGDDEMGRGMGVHLPKVQSSRGCCYVTHTDSKILSRGF
mmetsp:Transcript_80348/g.162764  ORF Transcript_80348/g.162764 Transcript_80348/m.162764 type:complete len:223 (+) Transcript_80348:385-1053(+)